jgi:hypothetical protein
VSEEEPTVEREASERSRADPEPAPETGAEREAAVYGGDEVPAAFNDRVGEPTARLGRVVGLSREGDRLALTVETDGGERVAFALEDPAEGHLDGRLRRLLHDLGATDGDTDGVTGALVPLTRVDGRPAIDWERVPAAPTNPSASAAAATSTSARRAGADGVARWAGPLATLRARSSGLALWEVLLAAGGGLVAGGLAVAGGLTGAPTLAAVALVQVLVALVLVARTWLLPANR